ncbi:beta-ketoacyl-ACP synthase III [Pelagibacterium luteolum]|uniref:Beta-ketoacyl-[acyl-carrier-protein] synthase III n=1 Tax=Pelagibacterium luteolum TaxID=440168 RepID=A0A1G7WF82_9HYPH|nr:beta-ketoacyl-ACP synthase III [Pelagibacterium luteolum]SDG70705.1 3-oxoacyl-[acyl-carrier-protein] synthase-3 [Pelagibacterium luteolum]
MTKIQSVVRGVGGYLPERVMTNEDLSKFVDTSDEWIVQRTGIRQRHIAAEGELTSDLALKASQRALHKAGLTASDIDLIIVGTTTPDRTFPATAAILQQKLGITKGTAFDVQAVCSGFVFAVATADSYLKTGMAKRALVIGAETASRILDWNDRTTCVLFGDGAGAMVLEAQEVADDAPENGVLVSSLRTDGTHWEKLYVDGGVSSTQTIGHLRMEGREVFKHAVGMISDVIEDVLEKTGKATADLDWFVPHQANRRIIDGAGKKLGIPEQKTIITVDKHANTSAASVPLALWVASEDGRIKSGDLVMIEAMGGGFTWGASLIRW